MKKGPAVKLVHRLQQLQSGPLGDAAGPGQESATGGTAELLAVGDGDLISASGRRHWRLADDGRWRAGSAEPSREEPVYAGVPGRAARDMQNFTREDAQQAAASGELEQRTLSTIPSASSGGTLTTGAGPTSGIPVTSRTEAACLATPRAEGASVVIHRARRAVSAAPVAVAAACAPTTAVALVDGTRDEPTPVIRSPRHCSLRERRRILARRSLSPPPVAARVATRVGGAVLLPTGPTRYAVQYVRTATPLLRSRPVCASDMANNIPAVRAGAPAAVARAITPMRVASCTRRIIPVVGTATAGAAHGVSCVLPCPPSPAGYHREMTTASSVTAAPYSPAALHRETSPPPPAAPREISMSPVALSSTALQR